MNLIAEQPYIKIIREVTSIEQKDIEHDRIIYLYNDKVVTEHREFPIQDVIDMSHRKIGDEGGLLYIHTRSGLYSYTVKKSTQKFIEAFREHKKINK